MYNKKTENKFIKMILIALIFLITSCSLGGKHNFRNTEWGMSIEEVKAIETAKLITEDLGDYKNSNILHYGNFQIYNADALIVYVFWTKDKLLGEAGYEFKNSLSSDKIKNILCDLVDKYYDRFTYNTIVKINSYGKSKRSIKKSINSDACDVIVDSEFLIFLNLSDIAICVESKIDEKDNSKAYIQIIYESKKYTKYTGSDNL